MILPALVRPARPSIIMGEDRGHMEKIRKAIKRMRRACHSIGLVGPNCPVDVLVPEDGLLDGMPQVMLEQSLVLCTWPGADIRIGLDSDKRVEVGEGKPGLKVMYFKDRPHVIRTALQTLDRASEAMEKQNAPHQPIE